MAHADEQERPADAGPALSDQLGLALDAARSATPEFRQQDDYLLAHGASLMSDNSHEILHTDTLRRIVAAAVASEQKRWRRAAEKAEDALTWAQGGEPLPTLEREALELLRSLLKA